MMLYHLSLLAYVSIWCFASPSNAFENLNYASSIPTSEHNRTSQTQVMDPWTALAIAVDTVISKHLCTKDAPGATCDQNGKCSCPRKTNYYLKRNFLGNVTSPDSKRKTMAKFVDNGKSDSSHAMRAAVAGLAPDSICYSDSDCAGYPLSYCDGVCKCVQGSLNAGSTCIASAMQQDTTCPSGQVHVSEADACMTVVKPGEPCQYSQQCAAGDPGAYCLKLKCECSLGMRQSGNTCAPLDNRCNELGSVFIPEIGNCRPVLFPGSRGCLYNLQCSEAFPEATCIQQTCTCPSHLPAAVDGTCAERCVAGEVYSSTAGQCIPVVNPNELCFYSSQCQAVEHTMTCDGGFCRCPNGLVFAGTQCSQSCPIGYIANNRGICTRGCQGNQIEVGGECLNHAVAGQPCRVQAQCIGGSSCLRGRCACAQGTIFNGSICIYDYIRTGCNPCENSVGQKELVNIAAYGDQKCIVINISRDRLKEHLLMYSV